MGTTRRLVATIALAGATLCTVALLPAAPAPAAPPPATHGRVVATTPSAATPHVMDGRTEAVLDLGDRVIVGGTFTEVKRYSQPERLARRYLFAYDKATGHIDTRFAPQPDGRVSSLLLAPDGKVLVAGQFRTIGGRDVPYLAKLHPVTGAVDTSFNPGPWGMVYDVHLANGNLYVGGTFARVGTTVRTNFAVLDPATGAVRPGPDVAFASAPAGATRLSRFDITPDGRKLVAIGNFATVGGQARPNVAVLDLAPGGGITVNGWRTDQFRHKVCGGSWDTITYDVDLSPDGSYFVIVTTGGPGGPTRLCDTATRWEVAHTGVAQPTWTNFTGGDSLTSVAVTGAAVYVAGHQRWADNPQGRDSKGPGAVDRLGIAALDPVTGRALPWNPGRERGLVAPRLVPTPQGLYVLSDSAAIGGGWHPRLAFLPLSGAPAPPPPPGSATPPPPFRTVDAFTDRQFRDATGRAPTAAQLSAWRTSLANGTTTPQGLIASLHASVTEVPAITRLYSAYFLRLPDSAGLSYWVGQYRGGKGLHTISQHFSRSSEFVRRYGHLDNRGFAQLIYRNVLDRGYDAAGLAYWTGQLDRGSSRGGVMVGFSESSEYQNRTRATTETVATFHFLLRRVPAGAERSTWEPRLQGGTPRADLVAALLALPAYQARV